MAGAVLDPVVILARNVSEKCSTYGIGLSADTEKPDYSLRLLKGLDDGVQQNAVEATVVENNAIFVVLVKGVHGDAS
jgi:hypothetical protein